MYHNQQERMNDQYSLLNNQVHHKHLMNKIEMMYVKHQLLLIWDQQ